MGEYVILALAGLVTVGLLARTVRRRVSGMGATAARPVPQVERGVRFTARGKVLRTTGRRSLRYWRRS
ncbi:hypothetical protein [Noviherbaspirillum aridicola]|uniref:Uncharacterized protein n=1 Tax=Noviherbaspirillum aridicola TaxID=2849687 RepID=A0ABQ4Q7E9_9BURK|nr:hypothetical protein [Noviherbaspirillum aridicola]GIZ53083.1 hypothetical protein NCCP691_30970 [Noviherbaspirillum aridicola]